MKSQPGLPSIIVVSMCVSTTIACLWMRAARTAGVSVDAGFFAGACALSDTMDTRARRTAALLPVMFALHAGRGVRLCRRTPLIEGGRAFQPSRSPERLALL